MAKRFIDTELLLTPWVRRLPSDYKLLWIALFTRCDNAGFWLVDWDMMKLLVSPSLDPQKAHEVFAGKFIELDKGDRWFIPSFLSFQYPSGLQANNPAHKGILKTLQSYSIDPTKPLQRPSEGSKDMVMDKEEGKEMVGEGCAGETTTKEGDEMLSPEEFSDLKLKHGISNPNKITPPPRQDDNLWPNFTRVAEAWPKRQGLSHMEQSRVLYLWVRRAEELGEDGDAKLGAFADIQMQYHKLRDGDSTQYVPKLYNWLHDYLFGSADSLLAEIEKMKAKAATGSGKMPLEWNQAYWDSTADDMKKRGDYAKHLKGTLGLSPVMDGKGKVVSWK